MSYKYINTEYLETVAGGDTDLMKELIDMFREQVEEVHSGMESLLAENDYASLGLLAHKAKSSVAIMGMEDLAAMLKTFELQAKEGLNSEKYRSYINRFSTEARAAVAELDDMISRR